jgi:hypothetical protein
LTLVSWSFVTMKGEKGALCYLYPEPVQLSRSMLIRSFRE